MSRMSWILLGSVLAVASVRGEPAVTIDSVQGLSTTVSFTGLDAGTTNSLVLAWGGSDATGETPADWPNRRFATLVRPADATLTVNLPETVHGRLRAFLVQGVYDAPNEYVQNGLVNQWDGIDNAGTGVHDWGATIWKDKKGGLDLTLEGNGAWNAAGNGLSIDGASASAATAVAPYKTIEVLCSRRQAATGSIIFSMGIGASSGEQCRRILVNMESTLQFSAGVIAPVIPMIPGTICCGAAVYSGDTVEAVFQNGTRVRNPVTYNETWGRGDGRARLGVRQNSDGYPWRGGDLHTVRLYSRVLTEDEILANHRLDAVRYLGVPRGSAVLAASAVRTCAKGVAVVSTGFDPAGRPTNATLAFEGVDSPCDLLMAWGPADAGADPADWPNRRDLGVVEPEDEQKVVDLPAGWGDSALHARFFLRTGVDAPSNYAGTPVTWLDGIDNAGTGTHDPTATVWKDKAGALDFTLTNNAAWNATGNGLVVDGISAVATNGTTAYRTFQALFRPTRSDGRVIFISNYQHGEKIGDCSRVLVEDGWRNLVHVGGIGGASQPVAVYPYDSRRIRAVAGVYGSDHKVSAVYYGGSQVTSVSFKDNWGQGSLGATIGARGPAASNASYSHYPWYGEFYSLRLYNSVLSADQLLRNHRLDLVRYCGAVADATVAAASADLAYAAGTAGAAGGEEAAEVVAVKGNLRVDFRDGVRVVQWRDQLLPFTYSSTDYGRLTSAYVQDGLINWWDGVDNAGTGTHDPNAAKWKDKAGTLDMRLTENGSWNATHNGLDVNGCGAYGESGTAAYRTIDVAFKMRSGRILFASGCSGGKNGDQNPRFVVFDHANGISKGYFDGKQTTLYVPWQVDSTKLRTMTGVYNGSHTVTGIYGDGVQYTGGETINNTWNSGDSRVMVGERSYLNTRYPWSGEVYAIRLYNRELTSVEIGRNHALDLYRFSADGSTARSAIPAELFTARISVVQLTGEDEDVANWTDEVPDTAKTLSDRAGEGAVDWYARPGVWRVSLDLMYEGGIFHTETAVYDMRRLRSESAIFIFY